MIEIQISTNGRSVVASLPAEAEQVPVLRQVVRAFGEIVGIGEESLADVELAVTEGATNVVKHAYPQDEPGSIELSLELDASQLSVRIADTGSGFEQIDGGDREGFGLTMMEALADAFSVEANGAGTEVRLGFEASDFAQPPGSLRIERVGRRAVALVGAQADLPVDRLTDALLLTEVLVELSVRRIAGERLILRLAAEDRSLDVRVGPFDAEGVSAVLADSELPVVGRLIERLADEVGVDGAGRPLEHLQVRVRA